MTLRTLEYHHDEMREMADELKSLVIKLKYEGKYMSMGNLNRIRLITDEFTRNAASHIYGEERTLYPFIGRHIPRYELALSVLKSEHQEIKAALKDFSTLVKKLKAHGAIEKAIPRIYRKGCFFTCLVLHHVDKEERIISKAFSRILRPTEKRRLKEIMRGTWAGKIRPSVGTFG